MKLKPWTLKEQKILTDLYENKNSPVAEIAKKLNRTESAILGRATRLGLRRKTKHFEIYRGYDLLAEGSAKECAEKLGVVETTIYTYHHRTRNSQRRDLDKVILAYTDEEL